MIYFHDEINVTQLALLCKALGCSIEGDGTGNYVIVQKQSRTAPNRTLFNKGNNTSHDLRLNRLSMG